MPLYDVSISVLCKDIAGRDAPDHEKPSLSSSNKFIEAEMISLVSTTQLDGASLIPEKGSLVSLNISSPWSQDPSKSCTKLSEPDPYLPCTGITSNI